MERRLEADKEAAPPQGFDARAEAILAALGDGRAAPEADEAADAENPVAPMSWSKEEKAFFAQLPPELQAAVSRREAERERFLSTRNQDLARQQRELEGERSRVAAQLDALIAEAERDPVLLDGARLDWDRLRREDPAAFARKFPAYRQRVAAIESARAQREQALDPEREEAALAARLPEWRDPERREALTQDLRAFLRGEGYSPGEIAALGDHRTFLIAHDAMRWRQEQEARKAIARKKVATAPRTQKPGAAEERAPASERLANLRKRALQSGKLDDRAAWVLAALDDEGTS